MISAVLKVLVDGVLGGVVLTLPFWIVWTAWWFRNRYQRHVRPPQREKLLKPPGRSLSIRLDEEVLHSAFCAFVACALASLVESFATLAGSMAGYGATAMSTFATFGTVGITASVTALSLRSFRGICRIEKIRLGLRGEQAVAEVLNELREAGFRAFHDLQPGKTWNIDHVLTGTRGVFVIETKARSKHPSRTKQLPHEVIYDGENLRFPTGAVDQASVAQARRNSAWIADYLAKKTAETTPVKGLVVLPGWFVKSRGDYEVKAMNAKHLGRFLRRQPESISPEQVFRIITALEEKCRTIEF